MLRSVWLVGLGVCSVCAWDPPVPHVHLAERLENLVDIAAACTGAADPPKVLPLCYKGKGSVIGLSETVEVKLTSFADDAGTVDLSGTGFLALDCKGLKLKKSGQELTVDINKCFKTVTPVKLASLKYCSDIDAVALTIEIKDLPIPVDAVLARTDC